MIDLELSSQEMKDLTDDQKEIAKARKLEIMILPYLRRNLKFFYAGGNLKGKANSYRTKMDKNKLEVDVKSKKVNSTVCKPLCDVMVEILKENGINAETVSCDTDMFKHIDVLLTTKSGKKYIINYLEDIENIQTGMKTPDFASIAYYKRRYEKFEGKTTTDDKNLENIEFLTEEELKKIDTNLGYVQNNMYMNEVVSQLKKEFLNFKNIMIENEWMKTEDSKKIVNPEKNSKYQEICDKYNNMDRDEILEKKIDFLFKYFNDRMDLKGHTDFVMYYSRLLLKEVLTNEEYSKLSRYDCFIKKEDVSKNIDISQILDLENDENEDKIRFILLKLKDNGYAISTKPHVYLKLSQQQIDELKECASMTKSERPSDLVLGLCDKGNALPLVFHPIGSKILNERAKMIDNLDLTQKEKNDQIQKLIENIITTDKPITSVTIPYPDGTKKKIYIDENDEIIIKENNKTTKYHYDEENDEFSTEELKTDKEEQR